MKWNEMEWNEWNEWNHYNDVIIMTHVIGMHARFVV